MVCCLDSKVRLSELKKKVSFSVRDILSTKWAQINICIYKSIECFVLVKYNHLRRSSDLLLTPWQKIHFIVIFRRWFSFLLEAFNKYYFKYINKVSLTIISHGRMSSFQVRRKVLLSHPLLDWVGRCPVGSRWTVGRQAVVVLEWRRTSVGHKNCVSDCRPEHCAYCTRVGCSPYKQIGQTWRRVR